MVIPRQLDIAAGRRFERIIRGADLSRMLGMWWGELMTGLREFIETKSQ